MDRQPRRGTVHHRDIAHVSPTRDAPRMQRGQDRDHCSHPAARQVADLHSWQDRAPALFPDDAQDARVPDVVRVVTCYLGSRAVLAVTGDRAIDQTWIDRRQALVAEAEAVHHTRTERLDHHVEEPYELLE